MNGGPSVHVIIRHEGVDEARESDGRNQPAVVQSCVMGVEAPEKKITLFAFRPAILEKTASALGVLGFVWATVVLLGGFASSLRRTDFWLISIILLVESARIFSRSHELEWQNHALASKISLKYHSARPVAQVDAGGSTSTPTSKRQWESHDVLMLQFPFAGWLFRAKNVSSMLYHLQLVSATGCIALSVIGLRRSRTMSFDDDGRKNMKLALVIFYSLALSEAVLFWGERIYWHCKVNRGLFVEVNKKVFGNDGKTLPSVKRFYYDAYSKCIHGSIFDGLKMDLVSYAEENLVSDSGKEQLLGARILWGMTMDSRSRDDTIRKIETTTKTVERLIDMLSWTNELEVELREIAAEVVDKLAEKNQNSLRVAASPGSLESVSCLLDRESLPGCEGSDEYFDKLNIHGLRILKHLTRDQENCGKIGNSSELLSKIIRFTSGAKELLQQSRNPVTPRMIEKVKLALEVIRNLASKTGRIGSTLRRQLSNAVFTVLNIREILQCGENHPNLQEIGIEILTSLAMEDEGRKGIGQTGGVIPVLVDIFLINKPTVRKKAGDALSNLALNNKLNCKKIFEVDDVVEKLVEALDDQELMLSSGRLLRNLYAYGGASRHSHRKVIIGALPKVLEMIMNDRNERLEVSIGLASRIFDLATPEEMTWGLKEARVKEEQLAERLIEVLQLHSQQSIKISRMRRFVITLATSMMAKGNNYVSTFKNRGMEEELKKVLDTTSSLECFNLISGDVGLSNHGKTMDELVDVALEKLH